MGLRPDGGKGDGMHLKPLLLPKACILVLEQDEEQRAGLQKLLADVGYTIAEAEDSAQDGPRIDLVIAALGARPVQAAAIRRYAAPVIVLVDRRAWIGFDFFDAANALEAVAVLQRPCSRQALLRLIAQTLSGDPALAAPDAEAEDTRPSGAEPLRALENPNFA
jgi:hypothetical protein